MGRTATAALAALSLLAGFGVAQATGVRALGGIVLLAAGVACGVAWWRRHGPGTALALGGVYLAAFVLSHLLALAIGAWPSVVTVALVVGAASYLTDRSGGRVTGTRRWKEGIREG